MPDTQQQQGQLPHPQDAYNHLTAGVRGQVFFSKLASHGYNPRNDAEAESMMKLAVKLRAAADDPRVKAAEAEDSFAQVNADLDQALEHNGFGHIAKAAGENGQVEDVRNNLAYSFGQNPDVYNSVLSIKAAEAQIYQEQVAAQQ